MPASAAAGALVGVVGRLAGKKGAQAAAGAAAKEGAEEAVEGGAKAIAGKVQQGLGMVQANQQQAQQKRQNMQQRLQDATREGASTGSTIGKAVLVKERKSPEAMRHKREYDKKYESSPERVKYREELNRERRRRGIYGSHDHMDVSHTEGGGLTLESQHANRGRHFKERGTLRPIAKSLREDLELLRNLLAGPMDEQDKKIGLAMVGMLEERHENDDEEEEEDKFKHEYHGGFL